MSLLSRLSLTILAVPFLAFSGTTQGTGTGGPIPAGAPATTSGTVTSDIALSAPGTVASGNAVTVTLLGLQHDFAGDLQINLSYISSSGITLQSVDIVNRIGTTTANPYGTSADFGNNQGNGDNYIFNTDYSGNIWNVANCSDPPVCTTPYGDADSIPGVSTDTINNGQYFTSTTGGTKTNLSYAFAGISVSGGTWRLTITDAADPNVGSFIGWQISIVTGTTGAPATITATAGTPQTTSLSNSFASALQATVTDAGLNPVSGVSVTFTAPSSGASATFSGVTSTTAVTNSSGVAVSPIPVANAISGSYTVTASASGLTPASFNLTNSSATLPTAFTTYLGTYGSGFQSYSGTSVVLPLRGYIPSGASQLSVLEAAFNPTAGGATEYAVYVETDGAGGYSLYIINQTSAAPWPLLALTPGGSTITLSTPITLATVQITAYRFALVGGEFQLDLSLTRSGSFDDQIVILGSSGTNYSSPWNVSDGRWSGSSSTAPAVTLSPISVTFGNQSPGTSSTQTLTVTNSGSAPLSVTSVQVSGANAGDFTAANGCTSSVAAGANCSIVVTFDPSANGSRTATLSITDNATGSPQTVALSGTGSPSATPTKFTTYLGTYGSGFQTYSGTSVVLPLRGYIPGGASQMSVLEAAFNPTAGGATEYAVYVETDGAGGYGLYIINQTAAAPWPLLALTPSGSTVTLSTPITLGTVQITAYRFALAGGEFQLDLSLTRSGSFDDQIVILGSSGTNYSSPWNVSDGEWISTAASVPAVTLSPTTLNFGSQSVGSSASQTLTVTNSGSAALTVSSASVSGTNASDFTVVNGCTASVAPGSHCTISVTFDPAAAGTRTATLSIADNATGSPQTVAISGTGSSAATPSNFTTYLGTYGSGFQTYSGASVVLPLRGYIPSGASQLSFLEAAFNPTAGGATEYAIYVETDGSGGFDLYIVNQTAAAPWPLLALTPSGSTITLSTPVTLGTVQLTAYRFALAGGEFQLDLSVSHSGSFNDQIVILGSVGTNYSSPWNVSDGQWSNP